MVMQVKGVKELTPGPGETFYETPEDIHVVGRNAGKTAPVKFLAFFVKNAGTPASVPETCQRNRRYMYSVSVYCE